MKEENHILRGVLCTVLGGVCWGFSGTCGQYLFLHTGISPVFLTCIRLMVSGTVLTLLALPRERERLRDIWKNRGDAVRLLLYGICGLMLCQYAFMTAISYSNAATATVLQTLNLVLTMLIVCLRTRRLPVRRETVSLLLAVLGTYLMATGGDPRHLQLSPRGLFWGIVTAGTVTVYILIAAALLPKWGRSVVTGYGMLSGGLFLTLAARIWQTPLSLPPSGWLAVGAVVFLGTVLPFPLFMQGVEDIGPVRASMLACTEPVSATVFSFLWLKTRFSLADLTGFACIIATIFLLARPGSAPEAPGPGGEAGLPQTGIAPVNTASPEKEQEKEPSESIS